MAKKNIIKAIGLSITILFTAIYIPALAWAQKNEVSMLVSPMNQSIVLTPGDTYHGSFKIANPNSSTTDLEYEIERKSFYVDEDYNTTFDEADSPIVNWTTIDDNETGILAPNSNVEVRFTIDVPANVAGGGQYEAFLVKTVSDDTSSNSNTVIKEQLIMAHLVFAEIAGETFRQGEIININVPSFLLSDKIVGSSLIKNTGNIHGVATYTMQVFPLFSDEEIYTNEENPESHIILSDRALYTETVWSDTPMVGIFNVVYTVEFEGVTEQVSKMVIKCPIWLLFIIIFAIAAIIIYFVMRAKSRKASRKRIETE